MHTIYLLLGSNMGERRSLIAAALAEIARTIGVIEKVSHLYETAPWGITEQGSFLNQAIMVTTEFSAHDVLLAIGKIEDAAGRQRSVTWGPRTLDIDILLYDDVVLHTRDLTLPHPQLTRRRFALVPLSEIAGDVIHPVTHLSISQLLAECADQSEVAIFPEG